MPAHHTREDNLTTALRLLSYFPFLPLMSIPPSSFCSLSPPSLSPSIPSFHPLSLPLSFLLLLLLLSTPSLSPSHPSLTLPSLCLSLSPSHSSPVQTQIHFISCSLSSLRQTMTPIANILPFRGCWSKGLRTFRYSSEAFSRLVERDRWILRGREGVRDNANDDP